MSPNLPNIEKLKNIKQTTGSYTIFPYGGFTLKEFVDLPKQKQIAVLDDLSTNKIEKQLIELKDRLQDMIKYATKIESNLKNMKEDNSKISDTTDNKNIFFFDKNKGNQTVTQYKLDVLKKFKSLTNDF